MSPLRKPKFQLPAEVSNITDVTELQLIIKHLLGEVERLKRLAYFDELTGLPNRAGFIRQLQHILEVGPQKMKSDKRHFDEKALSVMIIDFDHFKDINDTYGHSQGDIVLRKFGQKLKSDKRVTDVVANLHARWGGEEFVVALPWTSAEGAQMFAERILKLARTIRVKYLKKASVSIGLTTGRIIQNPETLIGKADKALYEAKAAGRDQLKVA